MFPNNKPAQIANKQVATDFQATQHKSILNSPEERISKSEKMSENLCCYEAGNPVEIWPIIWWNVDQQSSNAE